MYSLHTNVKSTAKAEKDNQLAVSRTRFRTFHVCVSRTVYAFQSEWKIYSCLNVKKLLA